VTCSTPVKPGSSEFVDALAGNIAVGTKVTLSMTSGASKASATLTAQASAESSSTVVATTPTTAGCEAKLVVTKELAGVSENYRYHEGDYTTFPRAKLHWAVRVTNPSNCVARNVEIDDTLPYQFDCTEGIAGIPTVSKQAPSIACSGRGRHLSARVGDLAPHAVAVLAADGAFVGTGKASSYAITNVAFARADNASEEPSNTVHVDVVLHSKFASP